MVGNLGSLVYPRQPNPKSFWAFYANAHFFSILTYPFYSR